MEIIQIVDTSFYALNKPSKFGSKRKDLGKSKDKKGSKVKEKSPPPAKIIKEEPMDDSPKKGNLNNDKSN